MSRFQHIIDIRGRLKAAEAEAAILILRELASELQEMSFEEMSRCKSALGGTSSFTSLLAHADEEVADAAASLVNVLAGRGAYIRKVTLGTKADVELRILERPGEGSVALRLWRSALVLSEHMTQSRFVDVRGKQVLELGCGLGLPGIACAAAGAAHVCLSDVSVDSIELARRNAALNGLDRVVEAQTLDWDEPHDSTKFELIIAADVCYEECHSEPLARELPQLLERKSDSRAIIVLDADSSRLPCMRGSVPRFISAVAERGELRCLHDSHSEDEPVSDTCPDEPVRTLVYGWVESAGA